MQMLGKPEPRNSATGPREEAPNWIDSTPPEASTPDGGVRSVSTTEDDDIPF